MTVRALLAQGHEKLYLAEVETPLLDALVLAAHALGTTKEKLLASLPDNVDDEAAERYDQILRRRCEGTPVSYIRKVKEFWGLEFYVDERVLVPRPDTETLVEQVLQIVRSDPRLRSVHDTCAGSGCVGIALKSEIPELEVSSSDISAEAGEVLRVNSERLLGLRVPFFLSDLLEGVPGRFDVVAANPPYLRDGEVDDLAKIGWPEPLGALRGGPDGTAIAARLIRSASGRLAPGGWLALEAAPDQILKLHALLDQAGFTHVEVAKDLAGRDRAIAGRLPSGTPPWTM